jgi:hypothetical protein
MWEDPTRPIYTETVTTQGWAMGCDAAEISNLRFLPHPPQASSILMSDTIFLTASSTTLVSGCRTSTNPSPS